MLAAKDALVSAFGGRVAVDAAIGRQVDDGLAVLQAYRSSGALGRFGAVVIDLGTNGPMSRAQFDRMAGIVSVARWVVVVNVRVPRPWQSESNTSIDGGVTRYRNMTLADWYAASAAPGLLWSDGVHPDARGAAVYSSLVARRVAAGPGAGPAAPPTTSPQPTTTAPPTTAPASTTTSAPTGPTTAPAP